MNTPELKAKLRGWLVEAGVNVTPERLDNVFSGYPLNPNEGEAIVMALYSKGSLSSYTPEKWLNAVKAHKPNTGTVSAETIRRLMSVGDAEAEASLKSMVDVLRPYSSAAPLPSVVEEAKKQARESLKPWVDRIHQPQAYRNRDEAFKALNRALKPDSAKGSQISDETSKRLLLSLDGKVIADQSRVGLHAFIDITGQKPPEAHRTLDEAINRYNEALFEVQVIRDRTGWGPPFNGQFGEIYPPRSGR
ncbi:MAG TPA: hypothetical protein VMH80_03845 [Bryobacteraceae bacterium]|nr:hypothetical protein [Bryobacteraceae bacterium]